MVSSESCSSNDPCYSDSQGEIYTEFTEDEVALIIRMYNLIGNRWPLIAGRIPGRSAEQIRKYWIRKEAMFVIKDSN